MIFKNIFNIFLFLILCFLLFLYYLENGECLENGVLKNNWWV